MPGVLLVYDTTCYNPSGACCLWTVPANTYSVTFEIWGGGGGGGSLAYMCQCAMRGGPGAGGGYAKVTAATQPGCQYTVCAGNAGVSSQCYGAYQGFCCTGCAGGTSYVTGQGLSSFCALGGAGGFADFSTTCYAWCGCNFYNQGRSGGCNGDTVSNGNWGITGIYWSSNPTSILNVAGNAGGPGGGAGGVNISGGYWDGSYCAQLCDNPLHGRIPGGGGAGGGSWGCCLCITYPSGRGAPGVVRIQF